MNRSLFQLSVALAIIFGLQAISCSEVRDLIERAVDYEEDKLAHDEAVFKDIRIRYIVDLTTCSDRRSRRAAYKLFRNLQSSRNAAIDEILSYSDHTRSVKKFYAELRKINEDALKKVKGIEEMMSAACSSSLDGKSLAGQVAKMLNSHLKDRVSSAKVGKNGEIGKPIKLHNGDLPSEKDFWDESEVYLRSDKLGAEAIANAVQSEREALKDDQEQLEKMGRHRYCEGVDETVFKDWARTRKAAIEEVLMKEFAHPRDFRRELGKVHRKHLKLLPKLDGKLKSVCGSEWFEDMVHWMDVWFFERYTAAIRGENWLAYKENGEQSSDFSNLLSDRASI